MSTASFTRATVESLRTLGLNGKAGLDVLMGIRGKDQGEADIIGNYIGKDRHLRMRMLASFILELSPQS